MTTTPTLFRGESQANLTDSGAGGDDQFGQQIVGLANGTFVVLWTSNTDVGAGDEPGTDIVGQLYDAEGNKIGGEFQANTANFLDNEGDFTAAALPNGNFVIAYEDTGPSGTSIRFEVKSPTGVAVSSGTIAADPGAPDLGSPSITVRPDGSFLVAYQSRDTAANQTDTFATIVSSAGVAGTPFLLLDGSLSADVGAEGHDVDTATLTNGNYVVVARSEGADDGFYMRIVTSTGANVLGFTAVADTKTNGDSDLAPTVTALTGGGFVVAWQNTDANDTDVAFQVYTAAGAAVGGVQFGFSGGSTDNDTAPEVIGLPDGGFVLVRTDNETDQIKLQRFNATGGLVGTEAVAGNPGPFGGTPTVTLSDDGRLLVGWTNSVLTGGFSFDSDVEFAILDPRENVINGDFTGETITARLDGATVNGNGGDDTLLGQGAADTLNGGDGFDLIRGRDGGDLIQGGFNADTIFGDGGNDVIFAATQAGPTASIEGDSISGGFGSDAITGSGGADTLSGDGDNDTLTGGEGVDSLSGGSGDDVFAFAAGGVGSGETVSGGSGLDQLLAQATINFVNANLSSIEEIEFAANNSLSKQVALRADQVGAGIAANALIDGNLSSAADKLKILMLDDLALDLSQFTFQDFDTAGTENDRLQVIGDGNNETFVGSSVRDDIRANGGNDTMTGGGGLDVLRGGLGNDTYFVDQNGEAVEGTGQGTDTVNSTANYILYNALENLNLVGGGAINGTGNNLLNTINGNGAANKINGRTGNDTLTGGGGADQFLFDSSLGATNVDTITDFQVGVDEIRLDDAAFLALNPGPLAAGAFRIGTAATDASDRIIYNSATGELFYDPNGVGGAAAVRFAVLDPGLALTADDFRVF